MVEIDDGKMDVIMGFEFTSLTITEKEIKDHKLHHETVKKVVDLLGNKMIDNPVFAYVLEDLGKKFEMFQKSEYCKKETNNERVYL